MKLRLVQGHYKLCANKSPNFLLKIVKESSHWTSSCKWRWGRSRRCACSRLAGMCSSSGFSLNGNLSSFFWGVIILRKIIDKYTLASDFLCFCVIFSFNTHLLGIGFLCQSLVHGWSSARTASHPCYTRRSWC